MALETPDLEESTWFFSDVLGLKITERTDSEVYLRAQSDREHHTLCLIESDSAGVDHIGWRTQDPESLKKYAHQLRDEGIEVTWIEAGVEAGQGEAIRFEAPNGHPFEFYYDIEKPEAPKEWRSKVKTRVYSQAEMNRIAPRRIDHVNIQDPNALECTEWLQESLGFRLNEYFEVADGTRWGNWLSVSSLAHDAAIVQNPETDETRFHHIAYYLESVEDLFDAADIFSEHGIDTDGTPGQHAITQAKFLYVKDPGSGHRVELYTGGYLIFDPDWDPIAWKEEDIGRGRDHQWIGQGPDIDAIPY